MTLLELNIKLKASGYPVAYEHFEEENVPTMPFVCYAETGTNNFIADGEVYLVVPVIKVQLFTTRKDLIAESNVEAALQGIVWEKEQEYLEDELCYRTIYTIEI